MQVRGKIHTPDRAKQLRDFSGLRFGTITPTDIDGLIEYQNIGYVIMEFKAKDNIVLDGQRLALERLTDDLSLAAKNTLCIIAYHDTDSNETIDTATVRSCNIVIMVNGSAQKP